MTAGTPAERPVGTSARHRHRRGGHRQAGRILNLVDGSNLERNLYLTTQLCELGVPVIIALNMMDIVRKRGDRLDTEKLSRNLGCQVLAISALKGTGIRELIDAVVTTTASDDARTPQACLLYTSRCV